jgi:hypothetical protein
MRYVSTRSIGPFCAAYCVLLAACGGSDPAADPTTPASKTEPPAVREVEVYEAGDWRVEVARLEERNEALIRVFGSGGELDGVPLPYTYESSESGRRWVTQHRGRERSVLYGTRRRDGEAPYKIHLPGSRSNRPATEVEDVPPGLGAEIAKSYAEHADSGKVDELQSFDREHEIAGEDERYERSLERTREACDHGGLEATIDWPTVSDERLLDTSISSYCGAALYALRSTCGKEGGAKWVRQHVERVVCRIVDGEEPSLTLDGKTLAYEAPLDGSNLDQNAQAALLELPDEERGTLGKHLELAVARVCADEAREHFIVLSPREGDDGAMAYGTDERMVTVRQPWGLGTGWFLDPRQYNEGNNRSFRGHDLRFYSHVNVEDGTCVLTCGDRDVELQLVEGEKKAEVFSRPRQPPPFNRVPHRLARDRRGVYYYVDRGATEETKQDFRLYRGKRGAMRELDMRDIASDSEGEIYESDTGTLRLVVDEDEALWIRGRRRTKLKPLPINENYGVIFNELGVYLGEALGTPCDDL